MTNIWTHTRLHIMPVIIRVDAISKVCSLDSTEVDSDFGFGLSACKTLQEHLQWTKAINVKMTLIKKQSLFHSDKRNKLKYGIYPDRLYNLCLIKFWVELFTSYYLQLFTSCNYFSCLWQIRSTKLFALALCMYLFIYLFKVIVLFTFVLI